MSDTADRLANTTLGESEAKVASLRVEGHSFREIADELDMSPQSANKHWQRAKEKAAKAKESVAVFREIGLVE